MYTWSVSEKTCCSVLQCVAVCCSVLQCVAVCCSVLQCVAVCCSELRWSVSEKTYVCQQRPHTETSLRCNDMCVCVCVCVCMFVLLSLYEVFVDILTSSLTHSIATHCNTPPCAAMICLYCYTCGLLRARSERYLASI